MVKNFERPVLVTCWALLEILKFAMCDGIKLFLKYC